jgi:hypothetical protein
MSEKYQKGGQGKNPVQSFIKNVAKKLKRWNQRKNLDNFDLDPCWREVLWPILFLRFKELKI